MNQVPEIVCDVLFYLAGYVHYRTEDISLEAYKQLLMCQVQNHSAFSKKQSDVYNSEGWKED